jgi:two-component system chemotaxis response regulator CheY
MMTNATYGHCSILIVEDCEDAVPALQIALESYYACPVHHVPDGALAVEYLLAAYPTPLAIVTDLNLPAMHGFELIERIRQSKSWSRIPIIVISADTDPLTPRRAREVGADAFFQKPYSPGAICRSLDGILHDKHHDEIQPSSPQARPADPHPGGSAGSGSNRPE